MSTGTGLQVTGEGWEEMAIGRQGMWTVLTAVRPRVTQGEGKVEKPRAPCSELGTLLCLAMEKRRSL